MIHEYTNLNERHAQEPWYISDWGANIIENLPRLSILRLQAVVSSMPPAAADKPRWQSDILLHSQARATTFAFVVTQLPKNSVGSHM